MRKSRVLCSLVAVAITCLFIVLYFSDLKHAICGDSKFLCWRKYNLAMILSFFGPALLIPSLISLKVSGVVFEGWKKMTAVFAGAYLVIILVMPWSVGDEFAGFTKGMVGLVLSLLYLVASLTYLAIASRRSKV